MRGPILILASVLMLVACQKEENPFDAIEPPAGEPVAQLLPLDNFAGLHQRIFRPTCAVSGCHDGSFEPEFRSIAGAYNSLVLHPVTANDPQESFTYRVVPGDAQASFLHERLTAFVPFTSGIMPLDLLQDSDWPANEQVYIGAITAWIESGAPDMFGQPPTTGNQRPQAIGLRAVPAGTTGPAYPRAGGVGVQPIEVPAAPVDLWFAFADDATAPAAFTHNTFRTAASLAAFPTVPEHPLLTGATCAGTDFSGAPVTFTHRAALDLSGMASGTTVFVRAYVDDGDHGTVTEVPNEGSSTEVVTLFTLRIP